MKPIALTLTTLSVLPFVALAFSAVDLGQTAGPPEGASPTSPPSQVRRLPPPPDAASQAKAEKTIRDLYKVEYAARAPADRAALATALRKRAGQTRDDAPGTFVLLRESRDLFAGVGDFAAAFAAIDDLGHAFALDADEMKFSTLKLASRNLSSAETQKAFVRACLTLGASAVIADNYDLAVRCTSLAETIARTVRDPPLLALVQARSTEYARLQKEVVRVKSAETRLAAQRADAEDYLTLGRHFCFTKADWDRGLAFLAKSSDVALKALALKDVARPALPSAQRELGDAWWDAGSKSTGLSRTHIRGHAAYWYKQAAPSLNGLERALVEKRIVEATEELDRKPDEVAQPRWISKSATYTVVSEDERWPSPLPSLLDGTGGGYGNNGGNNGFAFHTKLEEQDKPYIVIDLGAVAQMQRFEIVNRRDDLALLYRAKTLAVWVSSDANGRWQPVWQADGASKEWTVDLPAPLPARYLKIGLREKGVLHLFSVKIYGSEGQSVSPSR